MALSESQLLELRLMIDEADDSGGWDETTLQGLAGDGEVDLRELAARIWEMKAAKFVQLANTSESGSSRQLSQIFEHAKVMADYFKKDATDTPDPSSFPRSTKIVRPVRGA